MELRPYQAAAKDAIFAEWDKEHSARCLCCQQGAERRLYLQKSQKIASEKAREF